MKILKNRLFLYTLNYYYLNLKIKKIMKKKLLKLTIVGMMLLVVSSIYTSCSKKEEDKDPCENVSCLNGGTCSDGTCTCATNYEGSDCGTLMRGKFVGNYTFTSDNAVLCPQSGNTARITDSTTYMDRVIIRNISTNATFYGIVSGSTNLTIPDQQVGNIPDFKIYGTGTMTDDVTVKITITLYDTSVSPSDTVLNNCLYTYTKL